MAASLARQTYAKAGQQARLALAERHGWELLTIMGRLADRESGPYDVTGFYRVRERARYELGVRYPYELAQLREEYLTALRASVDYAANRPRRRNEHEYPTACPTCGAPADVHCHTKSGKYAVRHAGRRAAPKPKPRGRSRTSAPPDDA